MTSRELVLPEPEPRFVVDQSRLEQIKLLLMSRKGPRAFALNLLDKESYAEKFGGQDGLKLRGLVAPMVELASEAIGRVMEMQIYCSQVSPNSRQIATFWHHHRGRFVIFSDVLSTDFAYGRVSEDHPVAVARRKLEVAEQRETREEYDAAINDALIAGDLSIYPMDTSLAYAFEEAHAHRSQLNATTRVLNNTLVRFQALET